MMKERMAAKAIIILSIVAGVAGIWDSVWWHKYVGRDSFWILPHMLLVSSSGISLVITLLVWYITRKTVWRSIALGLLLVVATQPLDNLWHSIFGVEDPSTIWIFWSPPHMLLAIAMVLLWLSIRSYYRDVYQGKLNALLHAIVWGAILNAILLQARPLLPLSTIYHIAGFWGAGFITWIIVSVFLLAEIVDSKKQCALLVVCGYLFFQGLVSIAAAWMFLSVSLYSVQTLWQSFLGGYRNIPGWVQIIALVGMAVWMDYSKQFPLLVRTLVAGGIYGILLYSFSSSLVEVESQFSFLEAAVAILASLIGGVGVYCIFSLYSIFQNEKSSAHHR